MLPAVIGGNIPAAQAAAILGGKALILLGRLLCIKIYSVYMQ